MAKILVVEDENDINNLVKKFLSLNGHIVQQAFSGTEALLLFSTMTFDCVILDLMLPGKSGEQLIDEMKQLKEVPIIVITAKDKNDYTVPTLRRGADDFLAKPFDLEELEVRVAKAIRLYQKIEKSDPPLLSYKDITINPTARVVTYKTSELTLTAKEFDILYLLMASPNQVFTKEKLFELVWEEAAFLDTNTVTMHVSNLRKKLNKELIKTVWGIGYKMA